MLMPVWGEGSMGEIEALQTRMPELHPKSPAATQGRTRGIIHSMRKEVRRRDFFEKSANGGFEHGYSLIESRLETLKAVHANRASAPSFEALCGTQVSLSFEAHLPFGRVMQPSMSSADLNEGRSPNSPKRRPQLSLNGARFVAPTSARRSSAHTTR